MEAFRQGKGINKDIFKEAVLMQMTWVGAPTVYDGDEAGVVGWTDRTTEGHILGAERTKSLLIFTKKP